MKFEFPPEKVGLFVDLKLNKVGFSFAPLKMIIIQADVDTIKSKIQQFDALHHFPHSDFKRFMAETSFECQQADHPVVRVLGYA